MHFLQIWIQPDRLNAQPAYAQRAFDPAARAGAGRLLASPDGADGWLPIRQQAWLRGVRLARGKRSTSSLDPTRRYWLHVASGEVESTAARCPRAMRWVSSTKPARIGLQGAATARRRPVVRPAGLTAGP